MTSGYQLEGKPPQAYERYLVPAFFGPCADQLLSTVPAGTGQRVLDVACGTGVVARRAVADVGDAGAVTGVDLNPGMIELARTLDTASLIDWRTADAAALPLADQAIDLVYCQQGLQFFPDRPAALREMHRVLSAGGRIALAVWRDIAHNPAFVTFVRVLERHSSEAAALMRAPFAGPGRDETRDLMSEAGFHRTAIRIALIAVRFPSIEEFFRRQVAGSTLAGPIGGLDSDRLDALVRDLTGTLESYVDDDGVLLPMQTWLVTAHR